MSYEDTYKLITDKTIVPDTMISPKIVYKNIKYINLFVPYSKHIIIFGDIKIIYPNIKNPSFYSYYFMSHDKNENDKNDIILGKLIKQNINIYDIIDTRNCSNNCKYVSVKCLQVDIIYMLRFAEFLEFENISSSNIIVPIDSIYKYYKYMIKFIRLHLIKKFNNSTLKNNKLFRDAAIKLIKYVDNSLNKITIPHNEKAPINILYKKLINDFHQAFFIKKTLFPEYEPLYELVTDYENTIKYINKSCNLFKQMDDNQYKDANTHGKNDKDGKNSKNSINGNTLESISIQYANKKINEQTHEQNILKGGRINKNKSSKTNVVLHENYSFEDIDLDNNKLLNNTKNNKNYKNYIHNEEQNKFIIDKIHKMLKNEIKNLNSLS